MTTAEGSSAEADLASLYLRHIPIPRVKHMLRQADARNSRSAPNLIELGDEMTKPPHDGGDLPWAELGGHCLRVGERGSNESVGQTCVDLRESTERMSLNHHPAVMT